MEVKSHKDPLHSYISIVYRRLKWAGHVARMGGGKGCIQKFSREALWKTTNGQTKKDNVKIDFWEVGFGDVNGWSFVRIESSFGVVGVEPAGSANRELVLIAEGLIEPGLNGILNLNGYRQVRRIEDTPDIEQHTI